VLLFCIATAWFIFVLYFLYAIGKVYFSREILRPGGTSEPPEYPLLTVVVPARNEEANIERCALSLLNQSYPGQRYNVVVVDDNSHDNTAAIVRNIQADHPNLILAEAGELPDGWTGKNNACRQGAALAEGDWICFVDADIKAEPELLVTAMDFAVSRRIDLLSLNPFQELVSLSERLLLPAVFISIAVSMNFARVNDPSRPDALANGQFMLFRRPVYDAVNGHAAVRDKIMDDIELARVVKGSGFRLYWLFGDELIRTRMYRNLAHIWEGFSKNLSEIMRNDNPLTAVLTALKSFLLGWMPMLLPILAWQALGPGGNPLLGYAALGLSAVALVALFASCLLTVRALKIPYAYVLSFPLGFTLHGLLALGSLWKQKKGGRTWKGRRYR
jgi:chlorobactene glucosyltransferase